MDINEKIYLKCPYCNRELSVIVNERWVKRDIVYCEPEEGGCDKFFAFMARVKIDVDVSISKLSWEDEGFGCSIDLIANYSPPEPIKIGDEAFGISDMVPFRGVDAFVGASISQMEKSMSISIGEIKTMASEACKRAFDENSKEVAMMYMVYDEKFKEVAFVVSGKNVFCRKVEVFNRGT